jgi:hypothetical protein
MDCTRRRSLWTCFKRCFASCQEQEYETKQQSGPRMSIDREMRIRQWVSGACNEHCESSIDNTRAQKEDTTVLNEEEINMKNEHSVENSRRYPKARRLRTQQKKTCSDRDKQAEREVNGLLNADSHTASPNQNSDASKQKAGPQATMWDFQHTFRTIFPDAVHALSSYQQKSVSQKLADQTWFAAGCTASRK